MTDDFKVSKIQVKTAYEDGSLLEFIGTVPFGQLNDVGVHLGELSKDAEVDGLSFLKHQEWSDFASRMAMRMSYVLGAFIGNMSSACSEVFELLHSAHDQLKDSNIYRLQAGLKAWAESHPGELSKIALLLQDSEVDSPFLSTVLGVWLNAEPEAAIEFALRNSNSSKSEMRRQAILSFGSIKELNSREAERIEEKLEELLASTESDTRIWAIRSSGAYLENRDGASERLIDAIESLASNPCDSTRHALIGLLVHYRDTLPPSVSAKIFDLMPKVPATALGTIELVDFVLSDMDVDVEKVLILNCLNSLLTNEAAANLRQFSSLQHKIEDEDHRIRGWYVVQWLLDGNNYICSQLTDWFPPLDMSAYDFEIDRHSVIEKDVFYLSRKIFSYFFLCHGPAVSLLCACLLALPLGERKRLEDDIAGFWLRNYPGDIELFEAACEEFPRKGLKASVDRLRKQQKANQAQLLTLAKNAALAPSARERQIQSQLAHERSKQISRMVDEKSVFSGIFQKSHLLYGRSSITYVQSPDGGKPSRQVIELKPIETSSAIPRMDVLCPARLNYLMTQFRLEKRPQ